MKKTAVILFNLGGPDSKEAIKPFLFNFFTDKNIVRLPYPFRWMIAKLISIRRSKREAGTSYGELGDRSPLLENSQAQASALEFLLNQEKTAEYRVFVCMRYWHPMADEVAAKVKEWGADNIVLLPLYPQYSTTTTRSSYQAWNAACQKIGVDVPAKFVCCYPTENGFIRASAMNLRKVYDKATLETGQAPRILFSAHGLPESIIRDGDPYQWQCQQTAEAIIASLGLEDFDWQVCYQSRVGRQKWIGPSTTEALQRAAKDNVPVVILPHAFTQEHVETLVEIEIEYRELAEEIGVPGFYSVPTVGIHPDFIRGLADMVYSSEGSEKVASYIGSKLCPAEHKDCAMKQFHQCKGACAHG